ncbi:MAG: UDP-N-acetylmuramoyl-tripeptide--D-alanyl-D-alanine ligase [Flavobacteriales bacterium]|jgi:UDP-N-acetylmuramoyl-tripeptide--D-alanyl-D-alanine ligase|nr:UDP-N-acetylmuramoyl-tripeptide--D-alanyl-D-alanine ligase [Flavobacteriales bacterium]MBK7083380.1 UDP-N-acetylmuramoyl-tripeptide--D-alanyl-D-alanine ligase [Flavobacteriales bacterium]MBK9539491.1 UDP-N-acetylmuramoyl-tripeptide--D-alanyl-D-alanine ligase [Flavobacteriales bacterium]
MQDIASLHSRFTSCSGVCTDTRQLLANGMFFALRGPHFDANTFAGEALEQGCACAVVDDPSAVKDDRFVLVPDVLRSLQELARFHRRQFGIPVLAITGTNGKTTTKELVYEVLRADRPTLATIGNLNNHIGVPLTLLRLSKEHEIAVIEMGANHVGDIAELVAIAEPTHGLITNIGKAHLEGFGGFEGVVRAKTEMYHFLRHRGGTAFVNADDDLLMQKSAGLGASTYGTGPVAATRGSVLGGGPFLSFSFRTELGTEHQVRTRLIGGYNLPNALAAAHIGIYFGIKEERIVTALEAYTPSNNRSEYKNTGRNQLILDAYNANPSSMRAALENFAAMVSDLPKLAVLGGMKELGSESENEHGNVVQLVTELGLTAIYIGPEFEGLQDSAPGLVHMDVDSALRALTARPVTGHLVLMKGSRGTRLETLVPAF